MKTLATILVSLLLAGNALASNDREPNLVVEITKERITLSRGHGDPPQIIATEHVQVPLEKLDESEKCKLADAFIARVQASGKLPKEAIKRVGYDFYYADVFSAFYIFRSTRYDDIY
jgi:hypothetical protein